ncbi:MAG TPA: type IV pilus twitching motility protein PilT [Polyangiaceae bacterium]|nr:type IV pilus twitching motility protein PilT [Polyangiaceae bacterium]
MAQLDRFIQAMFQRPGAELYMLAGQKPMLRANGRQAPIMEKQPSAQQLRQLVGEIVPTAAHDALKTKGAAKFGYQMVGKEPVELVVSEWSGETAILVRKKTDESAAAVPPMAPVDAQPAALGHRTNSRKSKRPSRAAPRDTERNVQVNAPAPKAMTLDLDLPPLLGTPEPPPLSAPTAAAAAVAPAVAVAVPAPLPAVAPLAAPPVAPSQAQAPAAPVAPPPASGAISSGNIAAAPPSAPNPLAPAPLVAPAAASGPPAIDKLFHIMVKEKASDLHLTSEEVPMLRKDGDMVRITGLTKVTADEMKALLWPIMPQKNRDEFEKRNDTDFAYEIKALSRFRCNVFRDRMGPGAVFRTIPTKILSAEELGLPQAVQDLGKLHKGLVLVTGPTGSGKSTTLAALIDLVNRTRSGHLITIEDPIEFVHQNKKCLVNQREVGVHTEGFKHALRAALREDPDIILVGEMRDLETIAIAIETAETGHLVFGTLHTTTAYSTVDRIIDQFPTDRQEQIRVMLSESLKGVVSQTLCKKIGGGRAAALEILIGNSAVANLIREGKTFQIPSIMQTGRNLGMQLLNEALLNLVTKKIVDANEAYGKSVDKAGMKLMFQNNNISFS